MKLRLSSFPREAANELQRENCVLQPQTVHEALLRPRHELPRVHEPRFELLVEIPARPEIQLAQEVRQFLDVVLAAIQLRHERAHRERAVQLHKVAVAVLHDFHKCHGTKYSTADYGGQVMVAVILILTIAWWVIWSLD